MRITVEVLCKHGLEKPHLVPDENIPPGLWDICDGRIVFDIPPDVYLPFAVSDLFRGNVGSINSDVASGNLAIRPRDLFRKYEQG